MRLDTLSYYQQHSCVKLCYCMRRAERVHLFLQGPGKTIIPFAKNFEIKAINSDIEIELPEPSQSVDKLMAYACGGTGCYQDETVEEYEAREEILLEIAGRVGFFLEANVEKREDGKYSMPVAAFEKVHGMLQEWDRKNFAD